MKHILLLFSICTLCSAHHINAQKQIKASTSKKYTKFDYTSTIAELEKLAQDEDPAPEVFLKLADAYYNNNKMEAALKWYNTLIEVSSDVDSEVYFKQAIALKAIGNYADANTAMQQFSKVQPQDSRALRFLKAGDYLQEIEKKSDTFILENLEINTPLSDFGASVYEGVLIFASSRDKRGKVYKWNNQPFLDLFQKFEDGTVTELIGDVNTKYHESSTSFTADGKTMYFTRNNYFENKLRGDKDKAYRLKIYKATNVDGEWSNITSLPFNSDDYSVAHPALSLDGRTLYFASDMPETLGASDIFKVTILDDGNYGEPINLGSSINTEGRENFPYISETGTLYFSSNGHIGLGGLDVYQFENVQEMPETSRALNVGKPINSPNDDFGYIINETTRRGYITSNRPGGKGDDDIYTFVKTECTKSLTGVVMNNEGVTIEDATVTIADTDGNIVETLKTDQQGTFSSYFTCEDYRLTTSAQKEGYIENSKIVVLPKRKFLNTVTEVKLILESIPETPRAAAVGTDLFELLGLNPIYFDYDKSIIRPDAQIELAKIITYMNEFPNVKVDVRSHTDSRGRDAYNLALSQRRNKSTLAYLVNQGSIPVEKLTGKGYGETQLINQCANGISCSKEDHQANRRSEFIVVAN